MKVGILGLGLIGGSMALAYAVAGHTVYAADLDESTLSFAMLSGAVHGRLDEETIPACELLAALWIPVLWFWTCAALSRRSASAASRWPGNTALPL